MPIRPDDAADLAKRVRQMYVDAESLILTQMARAIARTAEVPDHLTERLDAQRRMVRELDKILRGLDRGAPEAMARIVALAYNRGVGFAVGDADKAGLMAGVELFGQVRDTGTEVVLARAAIEPLGSMRLPIRRWVDDVYNRVTLTAAAEVASGAINRREASRRALLRYAREGVKGFTDRSGRQWEMGAYAEMTARTTVAQAAVEGHSERLQSYGIDTVIVSNASEECKLCRPFEGKVLSLTGKTSGRLSDGRTVVATLAEARRAGLYHPNCRHSHSIYLPGITKGPGRDTADPAGDKIRQAQRTKERQIRGLKRAAAIEAELAEDGGKAARAKLRAKQAEFREWREANDRKNLAYRTNPNHR